jgi:hypothetical protein
MVGWRLNEHPIPGTRVQSADQIESWRRSARYHHLWTFQMQSLIARNPFSEIVNERPVALLRPVLEGQGRACPQDLCDARLEIRYGEGIGVR